MYTVKHASALTGVPVATLRMWERRYGVVAPERTESGYRLYDDVAIARLTAMRALVEAGWPPRRAALQVVSGTVAPRSGDQPAQAAADGERAHGGAAARADLADLAEVADVDLLVDLAGAFDGEMLTRELDRVFHEHSVEELVDGWLMPALARLGDAWRSGQVSVAAEHFVSAGVHRQLAAALDAAAPRPDAPRVLVGLASGSRHELGVLAFAAVLARAGVNVGYVGGDVPPDSWVMAATTSSPAAVVLGVPNAEDVAPVRNVVAALHAVRPELPVFLGGGQQDRLEGAVPLGHDLSAAAGRLASHLQGQDAP